MSVGEARAADLASIKADRGIAEPVGGVADLRVPGGDSAGGNLAAAFG